MSGRETVWGLPLWLLVVGGLVMCVSAIPLVVLPTWRQGRLPGLAASHADRNAVMNWAAFSFLMLAGGVVTLRDYGWIGADLAAVGVLVFGLLFIVGLVLDVTIFLFNRPKFAVPPARRLEAGAWKDRLGRRRGR
jgi:hypothetical protein